MERKPIMRDVDIHHRILGEVFDTSLLSPDECERAARFHFDRDRAHFIAARSMLRQILGEYLNMPPESIAFELNRYGKPAVQGIFFNVSHSAGLAVYAVSRTRELGVDVEKIDPSVEILKIAERFFAPAEFAALRALPEHFQCDAFFNCWTRKEAYVKALGGGLSIDLASFQVEFAPGKPAAFLRGADGWELESFQTEPGYAAAVVAHL
jgi:4'-phosphopantetheinyl transferase